jgi:hypothetical protein
MSLKYPSKALVRDISELHESLQLMRSSIDDQLGVVTRYLYTANPFSCNPELSQLHIADRAMKKFGLKLFQIVELITIAERLNTAGRLKCNCSDMLIEF